MVATRKKTELSENKRKDLRIAELTEEIQTLRTIIAVNCPDQLDTTAEPPKITEFKEEICQKVIELGKLGYSENDMLVAMNIERTSWEQWKEAFPALGSAVTRARDLALAYYDQLARTAITQKDWKFPHSAVERTKNLLLNQAHTNQTASRLVTVVHGMSRG